jgi:hypothetical protein
MQLVSTGLQKGKKHSPKIFIMKTPHEMKTLSECINSLQEEGFKENFLVKDTGLYAPESKKIYSPEETTIVSFYRFEGNSDPADNSILYAIETNDKVKGLLTDSYGPAANSLIAEFIKKVEDIAKREHVEKK